MADSTAIEERSCVICGTSISHTFKLRKYCDAHTPSANTKRMRPCPKCGQPSWSKVRECRKCASRALENTTCERCKARGRRGCSACHWSAKTKEQCTSCGGAKKILARGMCSSCYAYRHREVNGRKPGKRHGLTWRERIDVFIADDWTCQICFKQVDFTADHNSDAYPSIDHILPQSRGGSDERSNLRTAHRICNSLRGAA